MTKLDFLNKKQKKEILRNIDLDIPEDFKNEIFDSARNSKEFRHVKLVKFGKKIYAYTGDLNSNQIINLSRIARIENVGVFLFELK